MENTGGKKAAAGTEVVYRMPGELRHEADRQGAKRMKDCCCFVRGHGCNYECLHSSYKKMIAGFFFDAAECSCKKKQHLFLLPGCKL